MSRGILFKAKRIDNGEWVEGYYVKTRLGTDIKPSDVIFVPFKINRNEEWGWIKIDPETLCQYTGLTDKNGKKIWENDIVKCKKYICGNFGDYCIEVGYVEMKHGAFGLHRIKNDAYYRPFKDWLEDYEYEVVGNIFDNPELLEVE